MFLITPLVKKKRISVKLDKNYPCLLSALLMREKGRQHVDGEAGTVCLAKRRQLIY